MQHVCAMFLLSAPFLPGGIDLDSAELLREVDAIREARQGNSASALLSIGHVGRLAERVKKDSEDVITEAWLKAMSPEQREVLLDIIALNCTGSGRYIPLLCYVAQFSREPAERTDAALILSRLTRLETPFTKSSIVLVLGSCITSAKSADEENIMCYALEQFLQNAYSYQIPCAERQHAVIPRMRTGGTIRLYHPGGPSPKDGPGEPILRAEPKVVRQWWNNVGYEMARDGRFDAEDAATDSAE